MAKFLQLPHKKFNFPPVQSNQSGEVMSGNLSNLAAGAEPMIAAQLSSQFSAAGFKPATHRQQQLIFADLASLITTKSYLPLAGCLLEHLLTDHSLSNLEKLFYLLVDGLAHINLQHRGQRSIALPAKKLATALACSKSTIFAIQKSLELKNYLLVSKDKNDTGQNKRNLLTPTLPDSVFLALAATKDRAGDYLPYDKATETKRAYLDRSKLFIPLNYQLLKILAAIVDLTHSQKLLWLNFYVIGYKTYLSSPQPQSAFSFVASYAELTSRYNYKAPALSKMLNALEAKQFICRQRHCLRLESDLAARQDKSLWQITPCLPADYILELSKLKNRANLTQPVLDQLSPHLQVNSSLAAASKEEEEAGVEVGIEPEQPQYLPPAKEFAIANDALAIDIQSNISSTDPLFSNFRQYINKDFKTRLLKNNSNLELSQNVLSNIFNDRFKRRFFTRRQKQLAATEEKFSISSMLIRAKLKILPKEKADKARKFAYALFSKKLATGYAASLSKNELAKQLICHAASWQPKKLGKISQQQQFDIALTVAWKAVTSGSWQAPVEWVKAEVLQYEYLAYQQKYQQSGILSKEIASLELAVSKLLGSHYNLSSRITSSQVDMPNQQSQTYHNYQAAAGGNNIQAAEHTFTDWQTLALTATQPEQVNSSDHTSCELTDCELDKAYQHQLDFTQVPAEAKNLTMSVSDDYVKINTSNTQEYYLQLKMLEFNDDGDFLMTARPLAKQSTIGEFIKPGKHLLPAEPQAAVLKPIDGQLAPSAQLPVPDARQTAMTIEQLLEQIKAKVITEKNNTS